MSDDNSSGRSLGGGENEPMPPEWTRPTAAPRANRITNWPSSRGNPSSGGRFATLQDMGSSDSGGPRLPTKDDDDDGDDDDDDDDDGRRAEGESWFAGGERSGISVQNPDRRRGASPGGNMVRDLLRKAAQGGAARESNTGSSGPGAFSGGGHTLGSDEVESTYVPQADASSPENEPTVVRRLTLWRDGFSVEDGELMRYDDPANEQILSEINAGRAPPHILNVNSGQPVELRVAKRLGEDYQPPPKKPVAAFSGHGNRLGAPVPTFAPETTGGHMPGSFDSSIQPSGSRESSGKKFEVDHSQPTTSIQLRLADGTRIVCRMNLTHTVMDIRNFINASNPENLVRPYTIGTTFPNRILDDDTATIKDAGLLNSVVVQRWI